MYEILISIFDFILIKNNKTMPYCYRKYYLKVLWEIIYILKVLIQEILFYFIKILDKRIYFILVRK